MFTKIAIIGTGNIGTWLFKTLQNQNNISAVSVSGRKIETLPKDCDLYIFALKDDIYEDVLQQISFKMPYAVHTSGSLSQSILTPFAEKVGVLYPYQTITQKAEIRKQEFEIPICLESCDLIFENALFYWAKSVFHNVHKIDEKQRFSMHLAAVFACNFTNAMYNIAYRIFKENNLNWSLIFPLLDHTLEKAKNDEPCKVQTGPAVRGDVSVMEKHCEALDDEELKKIYKIISKIIALN